MEEDTLTTESLTARPLPKWLTDQKSGVTSVQPREIVMKEDHALKISFTLTGIFILLVVAVLSIFILRKHRKQSS